MNSHSTSTRRRDQQWVPDHDSDRRRNRSATLPSQSYDPRSYPSQDPRYDDSRHRSHPRCPPYSHHQPTSKAYQHAQHPQPSSHHPPHSTPAYPSSRRPHPDPPESRTSRRLPPPSPHDRLPTAEETPRPSTRSTRPPHPSIQPSYSTPANQPYWNPPQDTSSSRRHRDAYRDRDRDQERERDRERERERERDRDRPPPEPETRYKDRSRVERHRERERPADVRYQDSSRPRYHDRRKDSDTEAPLLSGREGYASAREQSTAHRRHRTEDGTASTGRRCQPENTQNPITSHSTSAPQPQQTAEPPPAPRVIPLHLPLKAKPQRTHREDRPSTATGAQSGSDTERATVRHRMERTPSGPAVQRSNAHTSTSTRDKVNHDPFIAQRDDIKRQEPKYGMHQDIRHPLAPINVDIPLVTPGFKASALPTETRARTVPQIVSIRAGQGPSDPHDAHFKSSAISHSDAPQESVIHPPHLTSASIVKSSAHTRSHFSETRAHTDRPAEHSHPEPHGVDLPPAERMSIHESSRALPTPISKPSYARGNPEAGVDITSSSYSHSRPPSRSAHRTSVNNTVPPAVAAPRPARSASQGPQTNEPPTRPPSVAHFVPTVSSAPGQHSVPPSPPHQSNGTPSKAGPGQLSSVQPSPKYAHFHGVSTTSTEQLQSAPPTAHPTPTVVPQTLTSSRSSTRNGTYTDAPYTSQQSVDQHPTIDNYPEPRQVSNNTTVKASWVVQTNANRTKIAREDKYLRDHRLALETPQEQLRQVLSQDDDPFPRASSSMMKASQATTPSQRNSPGTMVKDASFGTPRGTLASNSPKSRSAREAPTPEQVPRQSLPPHLAGPPRISVVGPTPVTMTSDLPHGRVDHALLAPPFPAPARSSRSISSSQDPQLQSSQPVTRSISSTSYQPPLAPAMHTPSLFQPYQPPCPPTPEENGQSSPPPLPIPPPRGLEDSPPPPMEIRTSEIIPTRSQRDDLPQTYVSPFREVQSEMFHIPSQPFALLQPSSASSPRAAESIQPPKVDSDMVPIANGSVPTVHSDTRPSKPAFVQPDDVQTVQQEIMRSTSLLPSQPSAPPTRSRPKVTIEDVPDDSPVLSRGSPMNMPMTSSVPASRQTSQHITVANVPSALKPVVLDQHGHKSSPQSRSKDQPLHRNTEPSVMDAAPPMPPPSPVAAPTSTRVPLSAPPTQHTFPPPFQTAPAQRTTFHTVSSRTYQRAADMSQASKLSTSVGTNPGHPGSVSINKPTVAPVQTTYNPVSTTTGQHQPANVASASKLVTTPATCVSHPSTSAPASMTKFFPGSGPLVGAQGQHTSTPSTQPPSIFDSSKHQPIRPAPLPIPPVDVISSTVMSTTAVKNVHQEQSIPDTIRPRDVGPSATRNFSSSSYTNPTSTRPGPSSATIQQTHVPPTQPPTHNRTVSLPTTSASSAVQKPPSPHKYPQHISSAAISMQPFPSRPTAPESQSLRVPVSGHLSTPAPVRPIRLSPPDHTNDSDMLKTPSSIAPSPMLNPDSSSAIPQSIAIPIRARKESTESKDDKKKGLFGIFRTRTLSKAADPPSFPSSIGAPLEQGRVHPDASAAASGTMSMPRGVTSTSAPKESHSNPPAVASTSTRRSSQPKSKGRAPDPFVIPPPPRQTAREQRDTTPHIFTPFKFLHSKRNRTVSAASLDVCDGNTATNTVIGSPDHSAISQAQPLPALVPPDVRDPLVAASEWRDREEAERRGKIYRVRRPGVTFDLEEEPPSPAPGTAGKRKRLVRRPSGRAPTPGPPRG